MDPGSAWLHHVLVTAGGLSCCTIGNWCVCVCARMCVCVHWCVLQNNDSAVAKQIAQHFKNLKFYMELFLACLNC